MITTNASNPTMMSDKEYLNDSLATQKYVTSNYNTFAGECANQKLKNDFMTILNEEHAIQNDLFTDMNSHGWYPVEPADQNCIQKAKQKFNV